MNDVSLILRYELFITPKKNICCVMELFSLDATILFTFFSVRAWAEFPLRERPFLFIFLELPAYSEIHDQETA